MRDLPAEKRGIALVLTLLILVLITLLVLGLSSVMTTERSTARLSLDHQKAIVLAEVARDHALAVLRDGIEGGRISGKFWASQPGKITVFNSDGSVDADSSRDLSSGANAALPEVDLNQATFGGVNPIASASSVGAASAPTMSVNWVNVLSNPTVASSPSNPMVGRYAFWVDDESSKVNINTADGTSKYVDPDPMATPSSAPVSFGNGFPTEVSLQALSDIADPALAQNIASITGVRPGAPVTRFFNNAREILQPGIPTTAFQDNNFDLTSYNRSPELNIFGEPKIYFLGAGMSSNGFLNISTGPYGGVWGLPLREVYPSSDPFQFNGSSTMPSPNIPASGTGTALGNQLPPFTVVNSLFPATSLPATAPAKNIPLPQYFALEWPMGAQTMEPNNTGDPDNRSANANYYMGLRIAQYLKGYNSQGQKITWPAFAGSGAAAFDGKNGGKYTDRQIDSIVLQILDLGAKGSFPENNYTSDQNDAYSVPYEMAKGFLSGLPVKGFSRGPRLNQVLMTFWVAGGSPPKLSIATECQWYLPKEYKGLAPAGGAMGYWNYGGNLISYRTFQGQGSPYSYLNTQDCPLWADAVPSYIPYWKHEAPLGGSWMNKMLSVTDQDDQPAGIDLFGNDPNQPDPDQVSAAKYHPLHTSSAYPGKIMGSGPWANFEYPALCAGYLCQPGNPCNWIPGDYHSTVDVNKEWGGQPTQFYSMRENDPSLPPVFPDITQIKIKGGIAVWTSSQASAQIDTVPLDSLRGAYTGEATWDGACYNITDPNVQAAVMAAVIPFPKSGIPIPVPGPGELSTPTVVLMKVADPLVNNFPGDWTVIVNPSASDFTVQYPTGNISAYQNGAVKEFQAAGGGDPSAYWAPEINENIPKSARFPSVGYLQYVRTGLMPDTQYAAVDPTADGATQAAAETAAKGTPFRLLNFSPSSSPSQATLGGGSYPDWALLDLFTVPVTPQPLGATSTPPNIEMTYGGSTPGRVNVNSPAALAPFSDVSRSLPLEAVFKGLQVSNSYGPNPAGPGSSGWAETPVYNTVDEKALATAVSNYITTLGRPLMMPAEIANVPEVANYLYTGASTTGPLAAGAQSRNDLVRQAVGNLTTQSNTFSVWAVAQSVKKNPANTGGSFESGDVVLSEVRTHYIVERYIDTGTDGVPGNANSPGVDGIVGTPDDPVDGDDTVTPAVLGANPKMSYPLPYKYRVIASEEITN